ncbi:MAG: VCBS repeat-containing protein [Acidobacteriales bacterium]|nr:VCBS repeat-containing protein [Terriglobales bacterium]
MFLGYKLASSDSLSFEIEGAAPYQHCLSCLSKSWDDELMKAKRMWFGVAAASNDELQPGGTMKIRLATITTITMIVFFALVACATAQQFTEAPRYKASTFVEGVVTGDFNRDGKPDIAFWPNWLSVGRNG